MIGLLLDSARTRQSSHLNQMPSHIHRHRIVLLPIHTSHQSQNPRVKEPIFAIFAMLEAVRLVEPESGKPRLLDSQKRALNIGLGIGTAPSAMIAHGIPTTIIDAGFNDQVRTKSPHEAESAERKSVHCFISA